jgi:hypothetical protein
MFRPYSYDRSTGRVVYRFADGYSASVIPDLHMPLRFELLLSDAAGDTVTDGPVPNGMAPSLTTQDVEDLLEQIDRYATF